MALSTQKIVALLASTAKDKAISEGELSRRTGIPQPTIHRLLVGDTKSPKLENLTALGRALGVDIGLPVSKTASQSPLDSNVETGPNVVGRLPLISWVQAGSMTEAIDLFVPGVAEEWVESPWPHSSTAYCLTVRGISMYPDYREGEIILVEPELAAQHGDDVIARTPDGDVTFKRLQITEDGQHLLATNPDFPNRIIKVPKGTVICGVVVGSWMKRRAYKK